MKNIYKYLKILLLIFSGASGSNCLQAQCVTPVITAIGNDGPICEGGILHLNASGTVGGVSSGFVRMAGIGANAGHQAFNQVFSSGDRAGSIARISNAAFDAIFAGQPTNASKAAVLKAQYDVLMFTWASPFDANITWGLITAYLNTGGSVFVDGDFANIGNFYDGTSASVNGVSAGTTSGCNYTIVTPAPFPVLVGNGVTGCFANDHLRVNSFPSWMQAYIKVGSLNLAVAGIYPLGNQGRLIVQGPDQDFHAYRGSSNATERNQYQFILNQMDFLTANQAGFTWTGPNGFTSNESNPALTNVTAAMAGVYTATLTNTTGGGCFTTATTTVTINPSPSKYNVTGGGNYCTSSTGVAIGLSGSDDGVNYQLKKGAANVSTIVPGTGSAITFGNQSAGIYTVVGTNSTTGCSATMTGSATATAVTSAPTPIISTSGLTTFCPGGSVTLTSSVGDSYLWSTGEVTSSISVNNSGNYTVTITISGCSATSAATTVTVEDNLAPVPDMVSLPSATGECSVTAGAPTATDNCKGTVTGTTVDPTTYTSQGDYIIHWDFDDGNGNISHQNQVVNVDDVTNPSFSCPSNANVNLNATCKLIVPDLISALTGTDNCGAVTFTQSPAASTALSSAHNQMHDITITANDGNGNTSQCTVVLTGKDVTVPVVSVPLNKTINCEASSAPANTGTATATDNCDASPAVSYTDVSTKGTDPASGSYYNYVITRTWRAEDVAGNSSTANQTITVQDITAPTALCKPLQVYLGLDGMVSIAAAAINNNSTDNCSPLTLSISKSTFNTTNIGANNVVLTVTDASGNNSNCTAVVTILKRPTTLVYTGDGTEQYSDRQTLTATLNDQLTGTPLASKTIGFVIGSQSKSGSTNATGVVNEFLILTQNPAPVYSVASSFAGDATFMPSSDNDAFDILQEDARAYYTGALFASTSGATSSTATVTLSATIKDITAVIGDAAYDVFAGDIRNATVSFIDRDNGNAVIATVPVGLVLAGDLLTGTATYNWATSIGTGDSKQFTIGIRVNNYYTRNAGEENTIVTVSKPLNDFITGGGYLVLTNSAGQKAGTAGTKNNFGFNVKFNKRGTNLQGNINSIFRRMETDGILHVYQVKGNAMTSLSVNSNDAAAKKAVFNGKANMQDITNPLAPVSLGGNLTLQVSMTDKGEPGTADQIAITVWSNDGGTLFSSKWNGTSTVEQVLGGGNLQVNGGNYSTGTNLITTTAPVPITEALITTKNPSPVNEESMQVIAWPNPSSSLFNLNISGNANERITIKVTDVLGSVKELKYNVPLHSTIKLGYNYSPGTYFIEVQQGKEKRQLKLIKL